MNKKKNKPFIPFSKNTVLSARYESYVLAIILIVMVCFDKDVSAIAILLSLSWGGYRVLQNYYIWMAKNEHVYEMKLKYKAKGLDSGSLDLEQDELENESLESEETL